MSRPAKVRRRCLSGIGSDHTFLSRKPAHRICSRCRQVIRCRLAKCPPSGIRECAVRAEGVAP